MKKTNLAVKNAREGILLITPLILGFLVFYSVPFLLVVRNAVFSGVGYSERFVGLGNFWSLLKSSPFRLTFGNTLKFLLISLPTLVVTAFAIALMLKTRAKKNQALKSVLLLPYILPVVGSVMLVELIFSRTGLMNAGLAALGLPAADWLKSDNAFLVVLLLYLWKNTGYGVILLLSGLNTISDELYGAANLDGAGRWQQLWYITIPQMWYSVFFTAVFSLINAFKCFREIFLIGGTHPHPSIYMLQHFINNAFDKLSFSKLAVASVLLLLVLTGVFILGYRWVLRKEAYKQ